MTKVAMCHCGKPLVMTFVFSKKEFVCADCLRTYAYFGPLPADETPELLDQIVEQKIKWATLSQGLIGSGAYHDDCPVCSKFREPHLRHASDEELEAHRQASERIRLAGGVLT